MMMNFGSIFSRFLSTSNGYDVEIGSLYSFSHEGTKDMDDLGPKAESHPEHLITP